MQQHAPSQTLLPAHHASSHQVFILLFTMEMGLKLVALGLKTYFSAAFNVLDAIVVVSSWLQYVPGVPNVSILRLICVLRPLRTINRIQVQHDVNACCREDLHILVSACSRCGL